MTFDMPQHTRSSVNYVGKPDCHKIRVGVYALRVMHTPVQCPKWCVNSKRSSLFSFFEADDEEDSGVAPPFSLRKKLTMAEFS